MSVTLLSTNQTILKSSVVVSQVQQTSRRSSVRKNTSNTSLCLSTIQCLPHFFSFPLRSTTSCCLEISIVLSLFFSKKCICLINTSRNATTKILTKDTARNVCHSLFCLPSECSLPAPHQILLTSTDEQKRMQERLQTAWKIF